MAHSYSYDARNRLTNLAASGTVAGAPGPIASYAYTLDASGHRLSVAELSGRTVSYGYDNLYRLTSETIASDPNAVNGAVSYGYDPMGNRLQKTSTLPGMPGITSSYNANDQLATDTYDNDGNTTASAGKGYAYDFENHLVQQAGITIVYDADGNRVVKTTANGTTKFLVDTLNPTGYAQVMDELQSGIVARTYTWGLELISEDQSINSTPTTSYYVFDGHGSVRALTNAAGAVSDTYDYDAFGILLHSTGTTPNVYLWRGTAAHSFVMSAVYTLLIIRAPISSHVPVSMFLAELALSLHESLKWSEVTRSASRPGVATWQTRIISISR